MRQITGNTIFEIGLGIMIFAVVLAVVYIILSRVHCHRLKHQLELEYGKRPRNAKRHSKE